MLEINKFNSKQILEKFQEFKIDNLECLFIASNLGKIGLIPGHDRKYVLNSKKIRRKLNWKPNYNFKNGLKLTIDWNLKNLNWWSKK